jgi:hypothetical protein
MLKITHKVGATVGIIIALILSGLTLTWIIDEDYATLKLDGKVLAKHRWTVDMERTWSTINYAYQRDNCIRDGGEIRDYDKAKSRCYYPTDFYTSLNRKKSGIDVNYEITNKDVVVNKVTPFFKYGTRGVIGATIKEMFEFRDTENIEEFPKNYEVQLIPEDTTKYKAVWRIENIKDFNLPSGVYHDCKYQFGRLKIDLKSDCYKLDYAEADADKNRLYFYFNANKGEQVFNVAMFDPEVEQPTVYYKFNENSLGKLVDEYGIYNGTFIDNSGGSHYVAGASGQEGDYALNYSGNDYHNISGNEFPAYKIFNDTEQFEVSLAFKHDNVTTSNSLKIFSLRTVDFAFFILSGRNHNQFR